VRVAEAGQGEYIVPAGGRGPGGAGGGASVTIGDININIPPGSALDPQAVANAVYAALRNGALQLPAAA
jgi:hypothetical protein